MAEHAGHIVQWMTWEGGLYRLYCLTCDRLTQITTQAVNTMQPQLFKRAMDNPYKEQTDERQPA